jgi:UDP-N-acetylglucosamine diphosphorylase/glucosamine-1-phosphate N-acetyltransferase
MIPLAGRPILEHLLAALHASDVTDILIVTGYRADQVRTYFGDGARWGLRIEYVHQAAPRGSGHALGLAEAYVANEDFLAVYGDLVLDPAVIQSTMRTHDHAGGPVFGVVPVATPSQYGIVQLQEDRVVSIIEKPAAGDVGNLANAGVYLFPPEVFPAIQRTPESPRGEIEVTDAITRMAQQGTAYAAHRIQPEDWMDVGRPWDLLEANRRVLQRCPPGMLGNLEEGAHLTGRVHVEAGATVRAGAYLEGPVFIGGGSDVGPNCYLRPFTSLERHVRVGHACEVKNSLILDGTHIAHLAYVGDSVIGANCNFGAGSTTANLRLDQATVRVQIKGEAVDSGRRKLGVLMGDDVGIGVGVHFMPGVTVGAGACIGPNTTVYADVPPDTFVMQKQALLHGRRIPR